MPSANQQEVITTTEFVMTNRSLLFSAACAFALAATPESTDWSSWTRLPTTWTGGAASQVATWTPWAPESSWESHTTSWARSWDDLTWTTGEIEI